MVVTLYDDPGEPAIEIRVPEPAPVRSRPASGRAWLRLRRSPRLWLAAVVVVVVGCVLLIAPSMVRKWRKDRCVANLRRIGTALIAYQDSHGYFPAAAITDGRGKPLLSWRVAILPELGYRSLHDRFRRDEPWDSPHNLALAAEMPTIYACPSLADRRSFVTGYQVAVGPGPLRPEPGVLAKPGSLYQWSQGVESREVIDGLSNTLMVAETDRAIPWTQPDDPRFDPDGPLPKFGSGHRDGFHIVLADGSTQFMRSIVSPTILRMLVTRDGNEILEAG